jgi:predicted O-methyltransferase YrrM
MKHFTQTWFDMNIDTWTRHLSSLKDTAINALEVGCFEGRATTWLLDNILTHKDAKITCIDTFEGGIEHGTIAKVDFEPIKERFNENIKEVKEKVNIIEGYSLDCLRFISSPLHEEFEPYDIVYIDGSHQAVDVLQDITLSWPLMKVGGIMILDDYMWDAYPDPTLNPRLAIDSFLSVYNGKYELLHKEYQVIVRKLV